MRSLIANIVCAFIPNKKTRAKVRVFIKYPMAHDCIKFVKNYAGKNARKIRVCFGVGAHNLVVILNDNTVFKFSLIGGRESRAIWEDKATKIFRPLVSVKIPKMELIKWRGTLVRKYECLNGGTITDFAPAKIMANREKIAKQLAKFLFEMGQLKPVELDEHITEQNTEPAYMYGWYHGDIGGNFMMDNEFNIIGLIDWEKVRFGNFMPDLRAAEYFWNKNGYRGLMSDVIAEYSKLWNMRTVK